MNRPRMQLDTFRKVFNEVFVPKYGRANTPFTKERLYKLMAASGFPIRLVTTMLHENKEVVSTLKKIQKTPYFTIKDGLVYFNTQPVYYEVIRRTLSSYYEKKEKPQFNFTEKEAISMLKSKGYLIFKDELDEARLKRERPEIYQQYLVKG